MNEKKVNCIVCKHFYITWDKKFPRGCKLFGFKSHRLPSFAVRESTGSNCKNFESKNK